MPVAKYAVKEVLQIQLKCPYCDALLHITWNTVDGLMNIRGECRDRAVTCPKCDAWVRIPTTLVRRD